MKLKKIDSCKWYHQTSEPGAKSIRKHGFFVDEGGNQRFSEGIYLLNHPEGQYGETTIKSCVKGKFLDLSKDTDDWIKLKKKYKWRNYTDLTKKIQKDNPKADGILFDGMLVVWYPKKIKIKKK